jgi:hypothetical protein
MKILVLCDDRWHPAQTVRQGLAGLESQDSPSNLSKTPGSGPSRSSEVTPLTILSKSNNVSSKDEEPWMTDKVRPPYGSILTTAMGCWRSIPAPPDTKRRELRSLLGGVFLRHPEQCPVTYSPQAGHPLVAGSAPFTHKDEYYIMALDDTRADVFLTAASEHGEQPAGWTRSQGAGRVCVLTPGHNLPVWQDPSYQALIANALHWCSQTS